MSNLTRLFSKAQPSHHAHFFLSSSRRMSSQLRSTPQYSIFGPKTMLSIKVIPPVFRCLRNGTLVLDNNRKGRVLLEWTPRASNGGIARDAQIRFGLSAEEVGFLLHQLPEEAVEFVRITPAATTGTAVGNAEKVFKVTPGEGGQFSFAVDFEKQGVGGQKANESSTAEPLGPQEVVLQLGEMQVVRELMRASIPTITGWNTQLHFAIQNSVEIAMSQREGTGGSSNNNNNKPLKQFGSSPAAIEEA